MCIFSTLARYLRQSMTCLFKLRIAFTKVDQSVKLFFFFRGLKTPNVVQNSGWKLICKIIVTKYEKSLKSFWFVHLRIQRIGFMGCNVSVLPFFTSVMIRCHAWGLDKSSSILYKKTLTNVRKTRTRMTWREPVPLNNSHIVNMNTLVQCAPYRCGDANLMSMLSWPFLGLLLHDNMAAALDPSNWGCTLHKKTTAKKTQFSAS